VSPACAEPREVSQPPQQRRPDTAQAGVTASANSPNGSWYRRAPAPGKLGAGGSGSRWKSTRSTLLSRPMIYRSMQSIVFIGRSSRSSIAVMCQLGGSLPMLDLGASRRPSRGGPALRNVCFDGTFCNRGTAADAAEKIAKCALEIADHHSYSSMRSAGARPRGRSHHTCCSQEDMHDAENSQRSPVALLPARDLRDPQDRTADALP
jgi:hypothetical protein